MIFYRCVGLSFTVLRLSVGFVYMVGALYSIDLICIRNLLFCNFYKGMDDITMSSSYEF